MSPRHKGRKHGRRHHSKRGSSARFDWDGWDRVPTTPKKPRAPRKKKESPLGTIEEVAVRPAKRIRIVEGE